MKPDSTWYANSQRIRILMMSIISGHGHENIASVAYVNAIFDTVSVTIAT